MKEYSHSDLCDMAVTWLYGTRRCNVALSGIASTAEIPDAIGWRTGSDHYGSIVVECKTSLSDFHANKRKAHGNRMGNWRYFLVPDGLIPLAKVWDHFPDHGLLYARRGKVSIIQSSKHNSDADLVAENRLLQFALQHVRENLCYAGCVIDMSVLTKAGITNSMKNRYTYQNRHLAHGLNFPQEPHAFNIGESR